MEKGIILFAFGKKGYAYAAYNLLISIKHFNKKIKVALVADGLVKYALTGKLHEFDLVIDIKQDHYMSGAKIDPGKLKVNIYEYLPFKYNLYLDVDALALQDLEPLIDKLIEKDKFYLTQVVGNGGRNDKINYNYWATNETEWKFFDLDDNSIFPAIQSSYAFIRKGREAKDFFKKVRKNYENFPLEKLSNTWGGTMPDELAFSGTLAQMNYDADSGLDVIFFGNIYSKLTEVEIVNKYYLLSIYGNGDVGKTLTKYAYLQMYDRKSERTYFRALNRPHSYKVDYIMRDKHATIRK